MTVCEFSVVPLGKGVEDSLSGYVARCLKIVRDSGLAYQLTPMGTVLEGEWDEVFAVIKRCRDDLRRDFPRVLVTIRVDDREAPPGRLKAKVQSVERKLATM